MGTHVWTILEARGIRQDWFAEQLGVSQAYVSMLKSGQRRWTPELKEKAAHALMLPESVLFFCAKTDQAVGLTDTMVAS